MPRRKQPDRRRLTDAPNSTCFSKTWFVPNANNRNLGKGFGIFKKSPGTYWWKMSFSFYKRWIRRSASVGRKFNRSIRGTRKVLR